MARLLEHYSDMARHVTTFADEIFRAILTKVSLIWEKPRI